MLLNTQLQKKRTYLATKNVGWEMKIGLDLDDTTFEYIKGIKSVVEMERGTLPEVTTWDFDSWGLTRDEYEGYHKKLVSSGAVALLKPLPYAVPVIQRLAKKHRIRFITARFRPKFNHANMLRYTGECLDANEIPYNDICFVSPKSDVHADIYLDDSPTIIKELQDAGKNVVIFDQPYNRELPGQRVKNWLEFEDIISKGELKL